VEGIELRLADPQIYFRDCAHCQEWSYNEATGLVREFRGQPLRRDKIERPPCRTRVGCPKGTPENPRTLSPANELAELYTKRCQVTGHWPDDPLVASNAAAIAEVQDRCRESKFLNAIRSLLPPVPTTLEP
jgi:hypothetical protein